MSEARILVIDDDPDILTTFEFIFKVYEPEYQLILLSNPQHIPEIIEKEAPLVIITDWEMPGMNGIEVIKEIRKNKQFDVIPIIMATGVMNDSEHLKIALAAGANDFILKPFDRIVMVARTRSMVTLARTMRNLQSQNTIILENNNFIRSLLQSVPHPMVYYTTEGVIVGFNERFESFTGIKADNLRSSLIYRCSGEKLASLHIEMDQQLINTGMIKGYETFEENGERNILHSKTLYYDPQGKPEGIMYILTDVTEIRKAQSEILDNKKRELVSNALRLIQMSEMNTKLIQVLKDIVRHTDKHGSGLIHALIAEYSSQQNSISWKEFETRFENVYEAFYQKLNAKHPELTPSERKLCALLRLNLSSKEIATLTFQNPQSIDIARYRIRKKLNLSKEMNLVSYFGTF